MHYLDQKRNVVNSHAPPEMIPDHFQADGPIKIPLAHILASWIWGPHASPRRRNLVKEAEFAVKEEIGESWSWDWGSVVVSEAEGVRLAGSCIWEPVGRRHVCRCVLARVRVSRIVRSRYVFPRPAYGPFIGTTWDPSPETQYHILSLELTAERVKLESEDARVANEVDPREIKQHTAISDRMLGRAIAGRFSSRDCRYGLETLYYLPSGEYMQPLKHFAKALWVQNGQNMAYHAHVTLHRRSG